MILSPGNSPGLFLYSDVVCFFGGRLPMVAQEDNCGWYVYAVFAAFILVLPVPVYFDNLFYGLIPVFNSVFVVIVPFAFGIFLGPLLFLPSLGLIGLSVWAEFLMAKYLCRFILQRIPQKRHGIVVGTFVFCLILVGVMYGVTVRVNLENSKREVIVENTYWKAIKGMF